MRKIVNLYQTNQMITKYIAESSEGKFHLVDIEPVRKLTANDLQHYGGRAPNPDSHIEVSTELKKLYGVLH